MPKKQKDGRYRAKIIIGYDTNNKPMYKYASGRTRKELEANKAEILRVHVEGLEDVRRDILFGAYAKEWYEAYKKPALGVGSQKNYDTYLHAHVLPAFAERQIKAIRAAELQKFLNERAHLSKTTINCLHGILRHVFQRATMEGIIMRDPSIGLVKRCSVPNEKRALTAAETAAVLAVGNSHKHGLLLLLLYYTGARRGEALGLQWQDIDFDECRISIKRDIDFVINDVGKVKTAASVRSVPMPNELYTYLKARRGIGETFVIIAPRTLSHLSQSTFKRRWEQLQVAILEADGSVEREELPSSRAARKKDETLAPAYGSILTPHYFRHNYASVLYNADVDVLTAQRFLGHEDARTTLTIYSHLAKDKEKEGAGKVNAAFKSVAGKLPERK